MAWTALSGRCVAGEPPGGLARVEGVEPVGRADPEGAVGLRVEREHVAGRERARVGGVHREAGHEATLGRVVDAADAALRGHPEAPVGVLGEGPDLIAGQAVRPVDREQVTGGAVETQEAVGEGAHPELAVAGLQQGGDGVVAVAGAAGRLPELAVRADAVEAGALGAHPHDAVAVLDEGADRVLVQVASDADVGERAPIGAAVE